MLLAQEDFEQQYSLMSDEELRRIKPKDLTEIARECYAREVAKRGELAAPLPEAYIEGELLVATAEAQLPPRCVKCGEVSESYVPIVYRYVDPAAHLLGVLFLPILRKSIRVNTPLCHSHVDERNGVITAARLLLVGAAVIGGLVAFGISAGWGILISFTLLFGASVVSRKKDPLKAKRIEFGVAYLSGARPTILRSIGIPVLCASCRNVVDAAACCPRCGHQDEAMLK